VDAVCIALTDRRRVKELARRAQEQERARVAAGSWPKREPLPPPEGWDSFRAHVMGLVGRLVVAHRPLLGLTGALHEEHPYGLVSREDGLFTIRIPASHLTPKMLLEPGTKGRASDQITVGKGGAVRDRALRKAICDCLRRNRLDPATFTTKQIKDLAAAGELTMPSGVPIRRVRVFRRITDPVTVETDPNHPRYYIGGNNHHMEIAEDERTGEWVGRCVTEFEAAGRLRPPRGKPELPLVIGPHLQALRDQGILPPEDEEFYCKKRFVLSLCKGEMLFMMDPDTRKPSYFVVAKINPGSVELVEHTDARPSHAEREEGTRRLITVRPSALRILGPAPGTAPVKVRVSVLGEVT
jgi:hypothetical protein